MEGTTIGRKAQAFATEAALESRFVDLFKQTVGMPLVWCSAQNIDRLVTISRMVPRPAVHAIERRVRNGP